MSMLKDIYDSRGNGRAVQVISECYILPEGTEAVCYQEMSGNYSVYVLEKQQFHSNYFKEMSAGRRIQKDWSQIWEILYKEGPGQTREEKTAEMTVRKSIRCLS